MSEEVDQCNASSTYLSLTFIQGYLGTDFR
jgi:hypothetical protein